MVKKKKKDFFESLEGEVISTAQNYIEEKVKKKILKIGEFSILVFLALIMISIGLAYLIGTYFPDLNNGLNFILLGMVFLIMGFLIRM